MAIKPFVGVEVGIKTGAGIITKEIPRYNRQKEEIYTSYSINPEGFKLLYMGKSVFWVPIESLAYVKVFDNGCGRW